MLEKMIGIYVNTKNKMIKYYNELYNIYVCIRLIELNNIYLTDTIFNELRRDIIVQ